MTSGTRTLNRVELARRLIGCSALQIVNLYHAPRRDVNELGDPEDLPVVQDWKLRLQREMAKVPGGDVLLAYGVQEPLKSRRDAHLEKLILIESLLRNYRREPWMVGGRPHHPSRWQRVTYRHSPKEPFVSALAQLLATETPESLKRWHHTGAHQQ